MAFTSSLIEEQMNEVLSICEHRFKEHEYRHQGLSWSDVLVRLEKTPDKLYSLYHMEETGGQPDVIAYDEPSAKYVIVDCSQETPSGRRRVCYDRAALEARKKHKPETSAVDMANDMGIQLVTEEQYCYLQSLEKVDTKTSSWVLTPQAMREKGGALFADFRFGRVFFYHNGAQSYYGGRGFRGVLHL